MKYNAALLVLAVIVSFFAFPLLFAQSDDKQSSPPADGVWKMRYDSKLDGQLSDKDAGEVRWKIVVRNNRVSGSLADLKDTDPADHRLAGEIVEGKPSIVFLRQDGPKGLVCFYTGKRIDAGRIAGTWFDNRGSSGDYELVIEKN